MTSTSEAVTRGWIFRIFTFAAGLDRLGMGLLRLGLVIVLLWIGGLKFASYEADSIVPLIANTPLASFMYHHPAPEYRPHMNKEGELKPANREWQQSNNTYLVSNGLGTVIVSLGILIALYPALPQVSAFGSALLVLMSFTTLSFLVTTPEAWVPALGDVHHGFPYLSGVGRLIIKDSIMLGAAVLTMADSARTYLRRLVGQTGPLGKNTPELADVDSALWRSSLSALPLWNCVARSEGVPRGAPFVPPSNRA